MGITYGDHLIDSGPPPQPETNCPNLERTFMAAKSPPIIRQLNDRDYEELHSRIVGAFYARHPEVQKAVNYDSGGFGSLTEKTKKMIRIALDRDAGMWAALDNIACDPHRRGNPQVFHNEWEEFSLQLVGYAREALGVSPLSSHQHSGAADG